MPLLLDPDTITTRWGRPVALPGVPTFNLDDRDFIVTDLDGWEATGKPDAVFVRNGGGPGAVATGQWLSQEAYLTVSGAITVDYAAQAVMRRALLAAVPPNTDTSITVYGWPGEEDLQAFVRLYDKPDFIRYPGVIEFVLPLIMLDPFKYALEELAGSVGVFSGSSWLETFTLPASSWVETFTLSGGVWVETYARAADVGPYPPSLSLTSPGDADSRRVTATVYGPLTGGDWYLLHENTGKRAWVQESIPAGQTIVLNFYDWSADQEGVDVSHRLFGSPLTLKSGANSYRLVSNTPNTSAYATLSALPAYE